MRNSKKCVLGIDPGFEGGVALVNGEDWKCEVFPTPLIKSKSDKRRYDIAVMDDLLGRMKRKGCVRAVIEQAGAIHGDGIVSSFSTGYGYGLWLALLQVNGYRVVEIKPRVWQQELLKKPKGRSECKKQSLEIAQSLFDVNLIPPGCRTKKDGLSDALLIALWGVQHREIWESDGKYTN